MDHSHNGAGGGADHEPTGSPSLHKKRSLVRLRPSSTDRQPGPVATNATRTNHAASRNAESSGNGKSTGAGQRQGSIRNVVRKIFGRNRSSRLVAPAQQHTTLPRHAYHRSEPHGLPMTREAAGDDRGEAKDTLRPALSTPLQTNIPAISSPKLRSPYAVEFPNSAMLKPLEISSPFDAPVVSLRRRKTLPSILIAVADATAITMAADKPNRPLIPARSSGEIFRQSSDSEIGIAISAVREKRRSRSAGGMRTRDSVVASGPARKRSEEIRFWRESQHGGVLRASGFTVPFAVPPPEEPEQDDKWHKATDGEPSTMADSPQGVRVTSHSRQGTLGTLDGSTQVNFRSTSGLSHDLEDRVAQLESNLQFFQRSLNKLQADRNRRTVIVGDCPPADQSKRHRTPSMLADDLHLPDAYADTFASEPPNPVRHAKATTPPLRSPTAECPPVPPLPGQIDCTTSPDSPPGNYLSASPTVTFKSLYQMLSDERSARRRLESQLHSLHSDIQDLQHQVSSNMNANSHSHRSSYLLSHEATVASVRLRDLLHETESDSGSPEGTPPRKHVYVSRFSASTTGGAVEESDKEEVQTPHEEWKTPREEQGSFRFEGGGEMF